MHNVTYINIEIDLLVKCKQLENVIWGTNALVKTLGGNVKKHGYWRQSSITFVRV